MKLLPIAAALSLAACATSPESKPATYWTSGDIGLTAAAELSFGDAVTEVGVPWNIPTRYWMIKESNNPNRSCGERLHMRRAVESGSRAAVVGSLGTFVVPWAIPAALVWHAVNYFRTNQEEKKLCRPSVIQSSMMK